MDSRVRLDPVSLPHDREAIVDFLSSQHFPFHGQPRPTRAQAERRIADGIFDPPEHQAFWVIAHGERSGLAVLDDLRDDTVLFDLRLAETARGQGLGAPVLRVLADVLFAQYPHVRRFEGRTRADNIAMRRTFRRAGWVQEAHYREGWSVAGDEPVDSVGYAILRRDWRDGTTTPVRWDDDA
ncbi:GNAT family N-acetyltransferase [Brachybacterium sp. YJGR34]|uniref:GNAT family N-acetyltransferase n=1 Tax=Brachybacterium sp. YJGR34 TaxID=2059911 RepID=UPI000E0B6E22|nr:GNAT family protein [Brachybacterium sp. YJGR34]